MSTQFIRVFGLKQNQPLKHKNQGWGRYFPSSGTRTGTWHICKPGPDLNPRIPGPDRDRDLAVTLCGEAEVIACCGGRTIWNGQCANIIRYANKDKTVEAFRFFGPPYPPIERIFTIFVKCLLKISTLMWANLALKTDMGSGLGNDRDRDSNPWIPGPGPGPGSPVLIRTSQV